MSHNVGGHHHRGPDDELLSAVAAGDLARMCGEGSVCGCEVHQDLRTILQPSVCASSGCGMLDCDGMHMYHRDDAPGRSVAVCGGLVHQKIGVAWNAVDGLYGHLRKDAWVHGVLGAVLRGESSDAGSRIVHRTVASLDLASGYCLPAPGDLVSV